YWASKEKRQLMKKLKPYKNSGDFGVFAFGLYNGQTANHPDLNNEFHFVTRFSYPIVLGNQIIEPGIQAYSGKFVLPEHSPEVKGNKNFEYIDQRVAASFVLYPKPFGIQAEYNVGRGPEFNKSTGSIEKKELQGGYVTFTYFSKKKSPHFIPFTRLQYYNGGKKHELDARSYTVKECELGIECHPLDHIELVTVYVLSDRRYEDFEHLNNHQKGELVRLQAQLDF
ncbi:MAG: OprO/OprP family phosphate-selective porin, partial [Bacteroidota bacterium]|nr:OprO/OprP family phosphate-selective porin [Bacteroidota bacterium]